MRNMLQENQLHVAFFLLYWMVPIDNFYQTKLGSLKVIIIITVGCLYLWTCSSFALELMGETL